jgi:uncharacterized sulfatase
MAQVKVAAEVHTKEADVAEGLFFTAFKALVDICAKVGLLFAAFLTVPACTPEASDSGTPTQRPNIVVLFADDMGYGDLSSYGHPYIRTPEIDELARQGQRWTDFYVAASVCSPSRGALLTGRLPVRTGIYGNAIRVYFPGEPWGMPSSEITMAEALQDRGYKTGMFGKWHLGDGADALPTRHGFDEWFGVPYSNDMNWIGEPDFDALVKLSMSGDLEKQAMYFERRSAKYAAPDESYWEAPLITSRKEAREFVDSTEQPVAQSTLTKRYTEEAIKFINKSGDDPFFLYVPYTMPHTPLFRSAEFEGKSLGGRYGDVVEEIDWSVGAIQDALKKAGVLENTLVVFSSDNGPWLKMHEEGGLAGLLRHGKGTTFEGGVRVPTVFSWPGTLASGVVSEIGSTLDLFATVMALTKMPEDAKVTSGVDGFDLTATLLEKTASPRQEMPFYRGGDLYAYRKGPWKMHFITEGAYDQGEKRTKHNIPQLYHLLRDPSERFDVAEKYPEVMADLLAAVANHQKSINIQPPLFDRRLMPR